MFWKKVLNQPNLVGTVLIALMVCSGFVYAFAFDGFNVETATGGEVEAWLAAAGGGSSGSSGGGGTEDTPPESPTPENPEGEDGEGDPPDGEGDPPDGEGDPPDGEGNPPDGEGDPPDDEGYDPTLPPDDEDPSPCDCDTTTDNLHACACGNKEWGEIMRTKKVKGKRKKVGTGEYGWLKPCDNVKVPYPCPSNCDRKAHIGDKKWNNHCPCPDHPRHSNSTTGPWSQECRKNWTVCRTNNEPTHCTRGNCKNGNKK